MSKWSETLLKPTGASRETPDREACEHSAGDERGGVCAPQVARRLKHLLGALAGQRAREGLQAVGGLRGELCGEGLVLAA